MISKKNSLAMKLLISYVILIVIPFFISSMLLSLTSSQNIRTNSLSYVDLFAEQISANLDNYIGELDRMTRVTTLDSTFCNYLTESQDQNALYNYNASQYLQNERLKMMTQQPSIKNVTFVGVNGSVFSGPSNYIKDKDLFYEITRSNNFNTDNGQLYLSAAHIPSYLLVNYKNNKEPVFTITRYLYAYNKKEVGAIVLTIPCQDLLNALNISSSFLDNGTRIVITNKEDKIVADSSDCFSPDYLTDMEYMSFPLSEPKDTKDLYFSGTTDVLNSIVSINREQLFKSTTDFNHFTMLLISCLIIVIIILSLYFSQSLVKPIKALQNAANACAAGDYSIRLPVTSQDEIGSLCVSFNFMTTEIQNLLNRVYYYELATKQAQLEALQNQISPHFLHNTLEIIRMKALINKDKEVAYMVQTLAKLFRLTLDRTSNIVTIQDELEHVETYLKIQNMRFNNRFHFISNIPEKYLNYSIIKLTLQPLVENAIKHGFSRTFDNEIIEISLEPIQNDFIIRVKDNGVGIDDTNLERIQAKLNHTMPSKFTEFHNSIGIVNIADRIRLEYGENYYLHIGPNEPRGTIVELRIPKITVLT